MFSHKAVGTESAGGAGAGFKKIQMGITPHSGYAVARYINRKNYAIQRHVQEKTESV
jgi:hypothetical protein